MAHMVKRLTNEGSTFLGEKIIEVRRVGPPQEVWYKLGESFTFRTNSGKLSREKTFVDHLESEEKTFYRWLSNYEICENFLPQNSS